MVWYFMGFYMIYIENYVVAWRYKISFLLLKNISLVRDHPKRNFVSPCNILYLEVT